MIQATKRKVTLFCLLRWDVSPPTNCFNPLLLFPLFDCQPVISSQLQEIRWPETLLKVFRAKLLSGQGCCEYLTSIFVAKLDRGTLTLFSSGSDRRKSPGIPARCCLCVRWLIANKLLLPGVSVWDKLGGNTPRTPGSWLERENHSLEFFKDIKKLIEVVPFPESRGLHPARLWPPSLLPANLFTFISDTSLLTLWQPPLTAVLLTNAFNISNFCAPVRPLPTTTVQTRGVCTGSRVTQGYNSDTKAKSWFYCPAEGKDSMPLFS